MKKLIYTILCLSIISFSYSQNADAEYLKVQKEYALNEDGSVDFRCTKELKLLSHYAFHRLYGETFILYNTEYQSLKINSAYTIMSDGKKTVTPPNAFNEVLPRFSTNAPAYNHIREMVVTHTGLEVGSTIHLDYTLHTEKGFLPALMGNEILSESSPVNELIFKINIPESAHLNFELLNLKGDPVVTTEKGKQVYTWTFKSILANSKDYYQLSDHTDVPRLLFSTAKDLYAVYKPFVSQEAFVFKTNAGMNGLVRKIASENSDQLAVALALQKVVANDLNTLSVPLKYNVYKCRTPIETWESNKGTKLEKVLLLTALLRQADINAKPLAIVPNEFFDEEIGDLSNFNEFLLRLDLENYGEIYLSADHVNKQNLKFNQEGNKVLLLDPNNERLKFYPVVNGNNKIFVDGEFAIGDQEKLTAKMHLTLEANLNPYFMLFSDPAAIKTLFNGGLGAADINAFRSVELSQEKSRSFFEIKKAGAFEVQHNYLEFLLPYTSNGVDSWHINLLTAERTSALEIPESLHEKYSYSFEIPADIKVVSPSKNIEIKNGAGYLLIRYETVGNMLKVTREIKLEKKIIELETYTDFKEIMDAWNKANFRKIILKK